VTVELRDRPVDEVVAEAGVSRAIGLKHVASLLFTYRCTIACQHCLFNCSPKRPDVCVSFEDGVEFMRQLRETDRCIHIAGGEAMMYYDEMMAICRAAHEIDAAPHFIETNASWCKTEEIAETRYAELMDVGVSGVLISADPYHQRFVPPERRERAYRWAVKMMGEENVAASDVSLERLQEYREIGRDPERVAEYSRENPPRFVGRAGDDLASASPDRPLADLADDALWHGGSETRDCRSEFDAESMWEIHIDPYGNIQTCCGIVIGNAHEKPLVEWMERGFHTDDDLVRMAYEEGPYAYLELARSHGYEPLPAYPQKCAMCWEARKFLRPHYPKTFGPAEIYDPV
jgi:hypothetical protein